MDIEFKKISQASLTAKQRESFNFQKISAVLSDYGYTTIRLADDWQGADFIAQHIDGISFLKMQLKGRVTFDKKHIGKDLLICFCEGDHWHIYPHDELLVAIKIKIENTRSWSVNGHYHYPFINKDLRELLERHGWKL